MAEEKKDGDSTAPKSKKKLVIIVAVVLVLVLGGVGAFLAMGKKEPVEGDDEYLEEEIVGAKGKGANLPPAVFPLETFIVNLQVKGSFLRTTIQLEFAEPELPASLENDVPKIKDAIIRILSSKSSSEVLMTDGKDKLRGEIRDSVNEVLGSEEVTQVYFTEFIIQ
ncbi:MAG TPA: flagellar basal body-associated FliL family protein [Oligoflexia bacterium]|nr:flagellar basal body-associated FliL family protein [Oligoflexia bacterium]HMP48774.1 flagellar basal body-associated FliL family protein [Oligoflexia bacterium]